MAHEHELIQSQLGVAHPLLHTRQMLPLFSLPGPDGMPHGPLDYKQKEHLIVLLTRGAHADETRGLLRTFAQEYRALRAESCAVLALTPDTVIANLHIQEELHLPFALLADPKGEVYARFTQWESATRTLHPGILLADRYGELYQQWVVAEEVDLPPIAELLANLDYLNRLCTP